MCMWVWQASFADGDMFGAGNADFLAMKATDKSGKVKSSTGPLGSQRRSAAEEGSASTLGGAGKETKHYESLLEQTQISPFTEAMP